MEKVSVDINMAAMVDSSLSVKKWPDRNYDLHFSFHYTDLVLTPSPTINAIEVDSVEITCDPTGSEEISIQVNGVETSLQFQDSNMQRVFTFGPVSRTDQGTLFQCFRGGLSSNTATLNVFCKLIISN